MRSEKRPLSIENQLKISLKQLYSGNGIFYAKRSFPGARHIIFKN